MVHLSVTIISTLFLFCEILSNSVLFMIYIYPIITFVLIGLVFFVLFLLKKKGVNLNPKIILNIFLGVLLGAVILKLIFNDGFQQIINGGYYDEDYIKKTDIVESLSRWFVFFGTIMAMTILLLQKEHKTINAILFYVVLPMMVFSIIFIGNSIYYYSTLRATENNPCAPEWLAASLTIIEFSALTLIPLLQRFVFGRDYKLSKKEINSTLKLGIFGFFICIPIFTYSSLIGHTDIDIKMFNLPHVFWILSIIAVPLCIYFFFKKEDKDIKELIMAILCLFLVFHYNQLFKRSIRTSRLPFQLCNLASYLFIVLFISRKQGLFNFIYGANPLGALIAVVTMIEPGKIFYFWTAHYIIQHLYVFIIPFLFIAFGLFERPNLKKFSIDFIKGFLIYATCCLLFNLIYDGFIYNEANDYLNWTNFFYLSYCPVPELFSFYPALIEFAIPFGQTSITPFYYLFIYVVFGALSFVIYFAEVGIYKLIDLSKTAFRRKEVE